MRVENYTPFMTRTFRDHPSDEIGRVDALTMVVWSVADSVATPSSHTPAVSWPRLSAPADLGYVQVTVAGAIRTDDFTPFTSRDAVLSVESEERRVRAFGGRRWLRQNGVLTATEPTAVREVMMAWANAYGGAFTRPPGIVRGTGLPGPSTLESWAANPGGTGFYVTEDEAEGGPLPNLEDAGRLIKKWDDRLPPLCWAELPENSNLRLGHVVDRDGILGTRGAPGRSPLLDIEAHAPPWLRFHSVEDGSEIVIEGFSSVAFAFRVPQAPFRWRLSTGDRHGWVLPTLWSIVILPNERLFISFYRTAGLLPLIRHEPRVARQVMSEHSPSVETLPVLRSSGQ